MEGCTQADEVMKTFGCFSVAFRITRFFFHFSLFRMSFFKNPFANQPSVASPSQQQQLPPAFMSADKANWASAPEEFESTDKEEMMMAAEESASFSSVPTSSSSSSFAEQIDYSQQASPVTISAVLSGWKPASSSSSDNLVLFTDTEKRGGRRSWGDQVCYNTGTVYGLGLVTGGAWGLMEGLRQPLPWSSLKLRTNAILNACTRRGPLVGNAAGVLTLFYTTFAYTFQQLRGQRSDDGDVWNDVAAGALAGCLFKSTAGASHALRSSLVFGTFALAGRTAYRLYAESPLAFRTSSYGSYYS